MECNTTQIGPYRGRRVATGGFADVYHIPQSSHNVPVAVKWAHEPAQSHESDSLAHEFAVLSELDHGRLPRALDFGWADNRPYLVIDWIEGSPLWQPHEVAPEDTFVQMLREIAHVLTFVHLRGWVHGDLKPENLVWGITPLQEDTSGVNLCLLDFGLARPHGDAGRPRGAGTVGYTAPEFLRREPADGRADWYSAGVILYEWLFGRRPFAADDTAIEIAAHLEQTPDWDCPLVRPAPGWATEVVSRLLSKNAPARASDVLDLLTWLGQFDPQLHPDRIINEQIDDHRRSEDRRLSSTDAALVDQLLSPEQTKQSWIICAEPATHQRLAIGLQAAAARKGIALFVSTPSHTEETSQVGTMECTTDGDAESEDSDTDGAGAIHVAFLPLSSAHEAGGGNGGSPDRHLLAMLPWDVRQVQDYMSRMLGDQEFARQWSKPVWETTGGLTSAISNLFSHLFRHGLLQRRDGQWVMADSALSDWQHQPEATRAYGSVIGELSPDERRQLDWFAVSRSYMHVDVLRELMPVSGERFHRAFTSLRARGVITPFAADELTNFFGWRLRFGGLADMWRTHMPATVRRRQALTLATLIESCSVEDDVTVAEVLAETFADAEIWDKCVHYSVSVVTQYLKENRQDDAYPYVLLAEAAADRIPSGEALAHWRGRAWMARGDYQKACGLIDEALRTYRQLLAMCRRSHDRRLLAETLRDLGDLYRMTRRFEKGVRVLRRARQLWEAIGDRSEVARTLNNLGNMYWVAADRAEARRYYAQALAIAEELGEDRTVAMILSNLGVAYKCEYDFTRAESYYRASLKIKERLGLPGEIALTVNNLGVIAYDQGRLREADQYFRRAITLNEDIGAEVEAVFARGNLTQVILERGNLRTTINEGDRAVRDAEALGDFTTAAEIRVLMAEAYLRAGDFRMAATCVAQARQEAADQRNDDLLAHLGLVDALRAMKLGLHDQAVSILDGIEDALAGAELPRLPLDALIIRLTTAVTNGDDVLADDLWRQGEGMAKAFSAPHKLAQVAFARLPADLAKNCPSEVRQEIEDFLVRSEERWHWLGAYDLWRARALATAGDETGAEQSASNACARLREDGNWETLWQALLVYGQIHYERSDYEPALRAFNEAESIRSEILKTIDDSTERQAYNANVFAQDLNRMRQRILELVA